MWQNRVSIKLGDIIDADSEAVVNAANNELWMGSGVAGALKRAGGVTIEQEAVKLGPVNIGESVITPGGNLKSLYVIHAAAMGSGRPASADSVRAATVSALKLAADQGIESISLPALGTGVGGLSLAVSATEMLGAVQQHCSEHELPLQIRFILFGRNGLDAFNSAIEELE